MFLIFIISIIVIFNDITYAEQQQSKTSFNGVLTADVLLSWGYTPSTTLIYLINQQITSIDDNAFNNFTEVRSIILMYNKITKITKNAFKGLSKLTNLNLQSNILSELDEDCFSDLVNLWTLDLRENRLSGNLSPKLFANLRSLGNLLLTSNQLTSFDESLATGFASTIIHINLEINRIENLKLPYLPRLGQLHIGNNPIKNINSDFFKNFPALYAFTLKHVNGQTSLPSDLFDNSGLVSLSLDNWYGLIYDKRWFEKQANLTELSLDFMKINKITNDFQYLTKLEKLSMNVCELSEISSNSFQKMLNLNTIVLNGNNLLTSSIDEDIFMSNTKLVEIVLSSNKFDSIPEYLFHGLSELTTIDLSLNQITSLDSITFSSSPKLKAVGLYRNKLTNIPRALFSNNKLIEKINLQNNSLTKIDSRAFNGLTMLKELNLKNNPFTTAINFDEIKSMTNPNVIIIV